MWSFSSTRVELPPEMAPLLDSARHDFRWLALQTALLPTVALGLAWGGVGLILGCFPRRMCCRGGARPSPFTYSASLDMHLAAAHGWAFMLHAALPAGPWMAHRLQRNLAAA